MTQALPPSANKMRPDLAKAVLQKTPHLAVNRMEQSDAC